MDFGERPGPLLSNRNYVRNSNPLDLEAADGHGLKSVAFDFSFTERVQSAHFSSGTGNFINEADLQPQAIRLQLLRLVPTLAAVVEVPVVLLGDETREFAVAVDHEGVDPFRMGRITHVPVRHFPHHHGAGRVGDICHRAAADRLFQFVGLVRPPVDVHPGIIHVVVGKEERFGEAWLARVANFAPGRAGENAAWRSGDFLVVVIGRLVRVAHQVRLKQFRHPLVVGTEGDGIPPGMAPVLAERDAVIVIAGVERNGDTYLAKVVQAINPVTFFFGLGQRRQQHGRENRDDRHHD